MWRAQERARSVQRDDRALRSAKRAMRMCPRSGQIFSVIIPRFEFFRYILERFLNSLQKFIKHFNCQRIFSKSTFKIQFHVIGPLILRCTKKSSNKKIKCTRFLEKQKYKEPSISNEFRDTVISGYSLFRILSKKSLLVITLCVLSDRTILWRYIEHSSENSSIYLHFVTKYKVLALIVLIVMTSYSGLLLTYFSG